MSKQRPLVGIRREDKNRWERRTALVPADLKQIRAKTNARAYVQVSDKRFFNSQAYMEAGAQIAGDLRELYNFVYRHLNAANVERDAAKIDDCIAILDELRQALTSNSLQGAA